MSQSQPFGRQKRPPATPGSKWGKLTVEATVPAPEHIFRPKARRETWVRVLCECGVRKVILANTITGGSVKSCGCKLRANRQEFVRRHTPALRRVNQP